MAKDSLENTQSTSEHTDVEAIPRSTGGTSTSDPTLEPIVETTEKRPSERREIVKSASLVMLGNLSSSIMGMVRQIVVAAIGASVFGAFAAALLPAQTFNDFLINGSVSGALIPTFNDYAEKRDELRRIVFTIVNLVLLIMFVASIAFIFISPWVVDNILARGYSAADQAQTLQFAQIVFFSLMAMGPFAVLVAALYSLKEFGWPAVATTSYHVGIIIGAGVGSLLGARYYGHLGLAFGVILGALGEIGLLIPGMRKQRLRYMLVLDLKHPALRRILKLYAPVAFSFFVSSIFIFLDQALASSTACLPSIHIANCSEANVAAMRSATTLVQFPIGLVAAALSFAVLPTLTTHAREGNMDRFKETLLLGFRLGLLLMIPAAAGLIILRTPIVSLIYAHHNYTKENAELTAIALQNYAYQLPFVAIDQLLIAAFYARKNTVTPVIVGFVSVLGYLAVALPFWHTIGMPALALANAVQNSLHAVILLILLRMAIGSINVRKTVPVVLKIVLATALMVLVAWGLQVLLAPIPLFSLTKLPGQLLTVIIAGGLAAAVYLGGVLLLKVEEINLLKGAILGKLGIGRK